MLTLLIAANSGGSVRRSPCSASQNWVRWGIMIRTPNSAKMQLSLLIEAKYHLRLLVQVYLFVSSTNGAVSGRLALW